MNPVAALAGFALVCSSAAAQPFSIDWFTIDGGGGTSSGGGFTLSGTIGQPDAGTLSGGGFTLRGGFWPGASSAPQPCNVADLSETFGILDLADIDVFINGVVANDPVADIAPPFGVIDLVDIDNFILAFLAGCP